MKKLLLVLGWFFSLVLISIYTHENPERIEKIKNIFSKNNKPMLRGEEGEIHRNEGNAFVIEFSKVLSL